MTQERLTLGRQGEEAAARYLQNQGMKIVERNLRTPVGEIDLVVKSNVSNLQRRGNRRYPNHPQLTQ